MNNNLGAFYQLFDKINAADFVLTNFKRFAGGPITIVSDGGKDFTEVATKHNCNYIHSFMNIGLGGKSKAKIDSEYKIDLTSGSIKDELLVYVHRFYQACKLCVEKKADYIMVLEDDVYITNPISINTSWDFCAGHTTNNVHEEVFKYINNKYNVKCNTNVYCCCGGSIFKTKIFVERYYDIVRFLEEDFDYLHGLDKLVGHVDCTFHLIYFVLGCKYSINPQFTEVNRNPDWNNKRYSIVHNYKELYR